MDIQQRGSEVQQARKNQSTIRMPQTWSPSILKKFLLENERSPDVALQGLIKAASFIGLRKVPKISLEVFSGSGGLSKQLR
eukprot:12430949-Karenia_brevis.AAC.1